MATQRNQYSGDFKAKVALEALKEQQTLSELGSCYGVHPTLVAQWKRQQQKAGDHPASHTMRHHPPNHVAHQVSALPGRFSNGNVDASRRGLQS